MRTLHETLNLQHHRHTGKVLHHKHTSYRGLAVVFIIAGFFIVGLNVASHVAADTFGITAMVGVSVPSDPPVINSPTADTTTAGPTILVVGSCPLVTPQVVVSVSVDGTAAGTGDCDSNNDFSVPVAMGPGKHQIVASSLTVSSQKGPSSSPVTITTTAESVPATSIAASGPFIYAAGNNITWTGVIGAASQNGSEYVHVDWGDNSQSNYTIKAGPQSFNHTYATLASHDILLTAFKSAQNSSSEQFAETGFSSASFPQSTVTIAPLTNSRTIAGLYGLYLSALCVTILIWTEAKHASREHHRQHAVA